MERQSHKSSERASFNQNQKDQPQNFELNSVSLLSNSSDQTTGTQDSHLSNADEFLPQMTIDNGGSSEKHEGEKEDSGKEDGDKPDGDKQSERVGNTEVKRDLAGNIVSYETNGISLSRHDDGKWYMHNESGGRYVEVDEKSIKMNDDGRVTYDENGFFSKSDLVLGEGGKGGLAGVFERPADTINQALLAPLAAVDAVAHTNTIDAVKEIEKGIMNEAKENPTGLLKSAAIGALVTAAVVATGAGAGVVLAVGGATLLAGELIKNKGDIGAVIDDGKAFVNSVKEWANDAYVISSNGDYTEEEKAEAEQGLQELGTVAAHAAAGSVGVAAVARVPIIRGSIPNLRSSSVDLSPGTNIQPQKELTEPSAKAKANEPSKLPEPETPRESLVNKGPEAENQGSRVSAQPGDAEGRMLKPGGTILARSAQPHADFTAGDFKANVNGRDIPLDKPRILLGRNIDNDIKFENDSKVSSKHAEIEFRAEGPVIRDSASTNGTFVNGTRIEAGKEVRLKAGDRIGLGPISRFTFGLKPEFHFEVNGRPLDLNPAGTNIGRSPENGLVLANNDISRMHASISNTDAGPVIRDLGSTNGTYLNGMQLQPYRPSLLKPGDRVRFGQEGPDYVLGKGMDTPALVRTDHLPQVPVREVMHYKVRPGEQDPAASPEAVRLSNSYSEHGEIRERLSNGFQTLSGDRLIKADGSFDDPHRPSLLVDLTRDSVLRSTVAEAHRRFDHLGGDQLRLAEELTRFSKAKLHPRGWTEDQVDASYTSFRAQNKGKRVLLGDYIDRARRCEGAGVCQHQALLNKVLADEFKLDSSLVSGYYGKKPPGGFARNTFANHVWNEFHINGKSYIFDPRHEEFGKIAPDLPKHTPARTWLQNRPAGPSEQFVQLNLKPGQIVNHDRMTNWTVSPLKPQTPGNIVLSTSATKSALADAVAALNENRLFVIGEKYRLRRSSGQLEEGWQLMGKRADGRLQFYKAEALRKEVTPQELLRENPDIKSANSP